MPIKVSDFIQNIAAYPVLRVEDNTILGYAYSAGSTQADLEAVPTTNRRAGLVLHNRTLYNYDLADTSNQYWGDVTKHKEIATRFSSYPVFPIDTYDTIGEALASAANDTVNFAVHRTTDNSYYKLASNNVVEWLVNALIQVQIAQGNGTVTSYVGTTGILGDLNNDGQVSTADLLAFLGVFGTGAGSGTYLPSSVYITNTDAISILAASGTSTYTANTPVFFTLNTGVSVSAGAFTININTVASEHYIEVTGTTNGSQVLVLSQFANSILYSILTSTISGNFSAPTSGASFTFGVKVETYSGSTSLDTESIDLYSMQAQSAGAFTTTQSTAQNLNNLSLPNLTINLTSITKVRFKFYGKYSTNNAVVQSASISNLHFKITP